MKATTFAQVLLAASAVVSACANKPAELSATLERAESIMYANPDSALLLLNEMPASEVSATPLNHATWCLLTTQARYKKSQEQSDSLLNIAHAYFMAHDNPQRKALSLYLHGELFHEQNDNEKAVDYLIKASEWIPYFTDEQLAFLIYSTLGTIYLYSNLDYAEEAIQKAYDYACRSKNKRYVGFALCLLARNETLHERWQNAIEYYEEAVKVAKEVGDTARLSGTLNELVNSYKMVKDTASMLNTAREAFALGERYERDKAQRYSAMAKVYKDLGKNDSAIYFADKAISRGNIYTRRSAYYTKYTAYKKKQDYQPMIKAIDKYIAINDSISKQERANQLIEMKEKYDEQQVINEKEQLKIEKNRTIWMVIGILALVLFVATYIIYWYQRRLLQKGRTIKQHEDTIRAHQLQIHENKTVIAQNESRIQELLLAIGNEEEDAIRDIRQQNETLQAENVTLQKEINKYVSTLTEKSKELLLLEHLSQENGYLRERTHLLSNELIKHIAILSRLKTHPGKLSELDWAKVRNAINEVYDDFTTRLWEQIPSLSENEMKLCCLIKLRLSVSAIAPVLSIESESVSKQKIRLKEHIAKETGEVFTKERTLDAWIGDY